jgi:tRNA 2-selenouridine synthase
MAVTRLSIVQFLEMSRRYPVLDVRSPGEFARARIPGAYSFPLFTDEERKVVGTTYKQVSREAAIKIGLDYFGPKMRIMIEQAEEISAKHNPAEPDNKILLVHCWRGGMRSAAIAWLLDLYGFKIYSLAGGYKKFRHWVIDTYSRAVPFRMLGGYTGSGKTYVIKALQAQGERVIDLEAIACHKGSAFGNIGLPDQPTQEHFENLLATALNQLGVDPESPVPAAPIWLEDESQRIGLVNIPQVFWEQMRQSPVLFLDIPFEERLRHIVEEYGSLDRERMKNAIQRISKRLGGLETKTALQALEEGDTEACFRVLLKYYDKWYFKGLHNRENLSQLLKNIPAATVDAAANAALLKNEL